jgi:hypothetical protein
MTNRLQAIIPAMFQPIDPVTAVDASLNQQARTEKITVFAAVTLALLLVALIAVLMGTT